MTDEITITEDGRTPPEWPTLDADRAREVTHDNV